MTDQIIRELWYVKDKIAQDHGYDLDTLVAYLQSKERTENYHIVDPHSVKESKAVESKKA